MDAAEARERFGAKLLAPVRDFAEVWFREWPRITFHDPLAAATIFDPAICQFTRGTVTIDTNAGEAEGSTTFVPGDGAHEVARTVNPAAFFDRYFTTVSAAG
jgi:purine nucleosidase